MTKTDANLLAGAVFLAIVVTLGLIFPASRAVILAHSVEIVDAFGWLFGLIRDAVVTAFSFVAGIF